MNAFNSILVRDTVAAGSDEPTCQAVHPEVENQVLTLAGADGQRAGEIRFPPPAGETMSRFVASERQACAA